MTSVNEGSGSMTEREHAERLAAKWSVYVDSLDGEHLILALMEAADAAYERAARVAETSGAGANRNDIAERVRSLASRSSSGAK